MAQSYRQPRPLRVLYPTIADQVLANLPSPSSLQELTVWCIDNQIVYPSAHWDASGLHFLGWEFNDRSRIFYDDTSGCWIKA